MTSSLLTGVSAIASSAIIVGCYMIEYFDNLTANPSQPMILINVNFTNNSLTNTTPPYYGAEIYKYGGIPGKYCL
jgi:hypothetical protein